MKSRNWIGLSLLLVLMPSSKANLFNPSALGGWAISVELFMYIYNNIEHGKNILELGSGSATQELAKYYTMYSIEHDKKWMDKYETTYIYAPIKNYGSHRWYNTNFLVNKLPQEYDLILIDGPPGPIGRYGFNNHLNLFNSNVMMIFDDVQRGPELRLLKDVARKLHRPYKIIRCKDGKVFGVIRPVSRKEKLAALLIQ